MTHTVVGVDVPRSRDLVEGGAPDAPTFDRNGLEVLQQEECLRLLATQSLGRLGITMEALPVILPVNFRLVGDRIVFRTRTGTKLEAATRNAVVAFEVDDMEPISHTGWSVLVTGVTRRVEDPADLAALAAAGIPRWAPSGGEHVVEVPLTRVSGRRIGIVPRRPAPDAAA
jgi:nitroimidazol reductase NimA-like FMN-containing flavoprotein (pyridoxamine 5'-phosphate oxidase superfamily)